MSVLTGFLDEMLFRHGTEVSVQLAVHADLVPTTTMNWGIPDEGRGISTRLEM